MATYARAVAADAELFAIEAELIVAADAAEFAKRELNDIADRYTAIRPPRPADLPKPAQFTAEIERMTFGEFVKLEQGGAT